MLTSPLSNYRLKNIAQVTIIGGLIGITAGYITSILDELEPMGPIIRGFLIAGLIGFHMGFFEEVIFNLKLRKASYIKLLLIRTIYYSATILFWLISINVISLTIEFGTPLGQTIRHYVVEDSFRRDSAIIVIFLFILISLLQIRRLHSQGNLTKFILGVYHKPKETDRIFLFLDLKSSTSIAEKLGNIEYSNFLIDYFYDITDAVLMADAEIYQYVGDEIILTWPLSKGIDDAKSINCFFDIKNSIGLLKDKYLTRYGVYPEFKAGLHGGKVVATWIGDIKKEIVYHGDVLNTASRLESECNRYNESLLISEFILNNVELPKYLEAEFKDELQLRGKKNKIKIYSLNYLQSKL